MKMHFVGVFFLLISIFINPVFADNSFLTNTSDIPLMDGMKMSVSEQMDFDTPTGQVLSLDGIIKNKTGDDVLLFYENVLPQMGWKKVETGSFVRQNDTLNIVILKNKKPAKVRFEIFLTDNR